MRGLIRAFDRERVEFLLIGGQAAILYGAAYFTQDLDVWIRPTGRNMNAFLRALGRVDARVHKLTPPLTPKWIRRGHGFHFMLPQRGQAPAYLDAMGRPPRVGSFANAARRARRLRTPWGVLPVAAIEDLADLKRTNRPGDYEAISRLVRIRLAETPAPSARLLAWALRNVYRIEDLLAIVSAHGDRLRRTVPVRDRAIRKLVEDSRPDHDPTSRELARAARALDARMAEDLEAGRVYWLPRVQDLKTLRHAGKLLPEGMLVRKLLTPAVRRKNMY